MSRGSLTLIVVLIAIVAGLVWLSRRSGSVPTHPIEQVVTPNGTADGAH